MLKIVLVEDDLASQFHTEAVLDDQLADLDGWAGLAGTARRLRDARDLFNLTELQSGSTIIGIVDLTLPDSFGAETFLSLHAEFPDVHLVAYTGNPDHAAELRGLGHVAVSKDETQALVAAIRTINERARTLAVAA